MDEDHLDGNFWSLSQAELEIINKYRGINRLKCACLLKFFQQNGRFPESHSDISDIGERRLSALLGMTDNIDPDYVYLDATGRRMRSNIRKMSGFRPCRSADYKDVQSFLTQAASRDVRLEHSLTDYLRTWFFDQKIERPSLAREERILNSARVCIEDLRYQAITEKLNNHHKQALDTLLKTRPEETSAPLVLLKDDPGKPALNSVFVELSKLDNVNYLDLPSNLFPADWRKLRQTYKNRCAREPVRELRRRHDHTRYALLAAFCLERREEILDGITNLLIQIVHKIQVKAERRVTKDIAGGVREVAAKKTLLFKIAQTAVENPDATIRDALFPLIGENTFNDLNSVVTR